MNETNQSNQLVSRFTSVESSRQLSPLVFTEGGRRVTWEERLPRPPSLQARRLASNKSVVMRDPESLPSEPFLSLEICCAPGRKTEIPDPFVPV